MVEGRAVVVDGQQRCTTACLLLSAIWCLGGEKVKEKVDMALFPRGRPDGMDVGIEDGVEEGYECDCSLVPTWCDRSSFFAAMLGRESNGEWKRPEEARDFFRNMIQKDGDNVDLMRMVSSVLRMKLLFFPLDLKADSKDGTSDLAVIFERLALREAMWARPPRKDQYKEMAAHDFCRNLLLGSVLAGDRDRVYRDSWLPLERMYPGDGLTELISDYLESMGIAPAKKKDLTEQFIGGEVYARFRRHIEEESSKGFDAVAIMERLAAHKPRSADISSEGNAGAGTTAGKKCRFVACSTCNFLNPGGGAACTACGTAIA